MQVTVQLAFDSNLDHIRDTATATKRNQMAASHLSDDGSGENTFTGFTDLTGWTVVNATTADEALAGINNVSASSKVVVNCNWNGSSIATTTLVYGPAAGALTANGAVDWGYNRPDHSILLRAGAGYAPTITSSSLTMYGYHWLEIRGITFSGTSVGVTTTPDWPGLPIAAFKNCSFSDASTTTIRTPQGSRVLHVEGCTFTSCEGGVWGPANYLRSWDNIFVDAQEPDLHLNFSLDDRSGVGGTNMTGWTAHSWISGVSVIGQTGTAPTTGKHPDFFQYSAGNDAHVKNSILVEFCVAQMDPPNSAANPQFVFGKDTTNTGVVTDLCVHNCVANVSAYWVAYAHDPADTGDKYVRRCIFGRSATVTTDTYPRILGDREVTGTNSGIFVVTENYFPDSPLDRGKVSGETWSGNVDMDPTIGAASGARPENLITGNGTWTTDGSGRTIYTTPDNGISDPVAARDAILAFMKPIGGWRVASAGPVDPQYWPTNGIATLT